MAQAATLEKTEATEPAKERFREMLRRENQRIQELLREQENGPWSREEAEKQLKASAGYLGGSDLTRKSAA